ncbi:uncharacterized protein [Centroberyx affinis]|uniref:uncharacterized protein n=1 Tax=Centroberyx affinis TaxID=166261 RepID=UPI003A5C314D
MFACETQILQQLAVLVVCHGLTVGQIMSRYSLVQRALPWSQAREFCQRHYVDLAVLSTEEQYFSLLNATAGQKVSFWLGLQRQSAYSGWKWVDGEELKYDHWYRVNYEGCCASLEAMLEKDEKLLGRHCDETNSFVCQGPVSPQEVRVDSVGPDHMILTWDVSAFMQMIPHSYNVTTCSTVCNSFLHPYTNGSTSSTVNISNLTSGTEYFIDIAAVVVRPDSVTRGSVSRQSNLTALQVRTAFSGERCNVRIMLKLLMLLSLAPPLWVLYRMLKRDATKVPDAEFSTEETIVELILDKIRESVEEESDK